MEAAECQLQITITIPPSRSRARYVCNRTRSFWNIAGDYFQNEARQDFLGEAALWAVLALTAFLPLISNAHAVMESVRAISGS